MSPFIGHACDNTRLKKTPDLVCMVLVFMAVLLVFLDTIVLIMTRKDVP